MKFLVTGTRNWSESLKDAITHALESFDDELDILIAGHATGTDNIAERYWLGRRQGMTMIFPAKWNLLGRKAGPIRNSQMLDIGQPNIVLAFPKPKSIGTRDMIRKAKNAGIKVVIQEQL